MKVLITGANGYIGSKVVKRLCDMNIHVVATDLSFEYVDDRAVKVKANIFDSNDNWFEYFNFPDVCLHLAWRDGFSHNSKRHLQDLSSHYNFLCNLIYNGLKHLTVMGSMHEVGYFEGKIDENTICNPLSNYGIAKNALRKAMENCCNENKVLFQWLRAFYIYGNDEFGNSIFCKIRQAVKNNQTTFPFTSGKNKYDFIHIDELANQISLTVIQSKISGIINVCSGKPVPLADQVEWYIAYNKLPIKLDYNKYPDRPYDSPCIYGDVTKIKRILNN